MPGTLLLEDLNQANQDELGAHVQSLFLNPATGSYEQLQPPAPTVEPVAQPPAPPQELQDHVDNLLTPTPAPAPTPVAPSTPPEAPQPTPTSITDELAQHVSDVTGGGLKLLGQGLSSLQGGVQQAGSNLISLRPTPPTPAPTEPTPAPSAPVTPPAPGGSLQDYARGAAQRAGIDPDVFVRQIQQESGFSPTAKSPAGAIGIAQFMPGTAAGMNVDPTDPYASLDAAARLDRQHLDKYGSYDKMLAAYNAGPGNVDKYGGVPPFAETQRYVSTILGGQQPPVTPSESLGRTGSWTTTAPGMGTSQFGDRSLSADEAYAACGPAAAVRFAQVYGRNPTLREAVDLAKQVGWTSAQGMAGLGSEKALMDKLGVPTKVVGPNVAAMAREAQTGNPVTISTQGHYFFADGYNPQTGAFHVGQSGMDLRNGSEWMTAEQMSNVMGPIQGALFADNPQVPADSTVSNVPTPAPKPDELPGPLRVLGQGVSALGQGAQNVLSDVGQTAQGAAEAVGSAAQGAAEAVGSAAQGAGQAAINVISQPRGTPATAAQQATPSDVLTNPIGTGNLPQPSARLEPPEPGLPSTTVSRGPLPVSEGPAILPSLDEAQQALRRGDVDAARAAVANSPLGPILGALRGPALLSDEELLRALTPDQLQRARDLGMSDQQIAEYVRSSRIIEAVAMSEAHGPEGAGGLELNRPAGEPRVAPEAPAQPARPAPEAPAERARPAAPEARPEPPRVVPEARAGVPEGAVEPAPVTRPEPAVRPEAPATAEPVAPPSRQVPLTTEDVAQVRQVLQETLPDVVSPEVSRALTAEMRGMPATAAATRLSTILDELRVPRTQQDAVIARALPSATPTIPSAPGLAPSAARPSAPPRAAAPEAAVPSARATATANRGGVDLDALAQMRAEVRRQAGQPPPPPPPGSAERMDYLTGRGKWAEPVTPQATTADKVMAVGVNGMLGGTPSMITNAVTGLAENALRPVATALVRGELGPAWQDVRAQGAAIGEGLANMSKTFLTGERPSRIGSADYPEAFPGKLGALPITTGNIRVNAAMDEFNKALAMAGGQAAELARLVRDNPKLSESELLARYRDRLMQVGTDAAKRATFEAGGTPIGDALSRARAKLTSPDASISQRVLGFAAQLAVPFSKIPDVILTRGVLGTPGVAEARAAVNVIRAVRAGDAQGVKNAVRQWVTTETVNAAIFWQVMQGNVTGNGPSDPAKLAALKDARDANGDPIWQPNSLRIPTPFGVRWIPYSSLGPIAVRLSAIANFVEQLDDNKGKVDPNMLKAVSTATGETITDAWYLQNVGRIFQALKNGTIADAGGRILLDFGERYVPDSALTNQLRQYVDPTVREPTNPLQDVANRVPGLSQLVPARINPATGEPLQQPRDVGTALVRASAPGVPDPINTALAQHNLGVPDPPQTITQKKFTIDITPDEQRQYSIEAGRRVAKNVQALLDNPRWSSQTYDQQREALQKAVGAAREDAAAITWAGIPGKDLDQRVQAYRTRQEAAGQPQFRAPVTSP